MPDPDEHDTKELALDSETAESRNAAAVVKISRVIDLDDEPDLDDGLKGFVRELKELVDEMAQEADWTAEQFLQHAGCTSAARVVAGEVDDNFMLDCLNYLNWVKGLLAGFSRASDRRGTVMGGSRLFVEANRDLHACKDALSARAVADNSYTGAELVRLGEIELGFETALANIDSPEGHLVKEILIDDPAYSTSPHLSEERVELLLTNASALGDEVAKEMHRHLAECPLCAETYRDELSSDDSSHPRL